MGVVAWLPHLTRQCFSLPSKRWRKKGAVCALLVLVAASVTSRCLPCLQGGKPSFDPPLVDPGKTLCI
jgi:hypothetical protein